MHKVEVIVLCEDVKHMTFILRYLRRLGFNNRQIHSRLPRSGRGAGEQWVRERYPAEVKAQRSRANHTSASLIAVIDADTLSVDERRQQLEATLDRSGLAPRDAKERISIVIPRRNIESWVHFAEAREIDETTDLKLRYKDTKACRDAADAAVEVCRSGSDEAAAPPSLVAACRELRRVDPR